jgi:predicted dehydrogenase
VPRRRQLSASDRNRLVDAVRGQLDAQHSLDALAVLVGMDVRRFTGAFHDAFGLSPWQYVMRARLDEAALRTVGAKTIAAYRTGLDIDWSRPTDAAVSTAARASGSRVVDPVLVAFGVHEAVARGLPVQVQASIATLAHERIAVEDTAVAALRYESGALGVIEAATSAYPGWTKKIEISGDQGSVVLEDDEIKFWQFAKALSPMVLMFLGSTTLVKA